MLISLKHKLAFLAVPKTGTTAIEAALAKHATISFGGPARIKHMSAPKFETMLRPYLVGVGASDVQTMAIMRDPIDHLQSWYFYRRRLDESRPHKLQNSTRDVTLEAFLEGWLSDEPPPFARISPQSLFLCSRERMERSSGAEVKPMVNLIFAYENMHDALSFLSERLRTTIEVERRNISKREAVEIPAGLRARLENRLANDIALHKRVLAGEFYPDPADMAKAKARKQRKRMAKEAAAQGIGGAA
jgi:hypothetical protein